VRQGKLRGQGILYYIRKHSGRSIRKPPPVEFTEGGGAFDLRWSQVENGPRATKPGLCAVFCPDQPGFRRTALLHSGANRRPHREPGGGTGGSRSSRCRIHATLATVDANDSKRPSPPYLSEKEDGAQSAFDDERFSQLRDSNLTPTNAGRCRNGPPPKWPHRPAAPQPADHTGNNRSFSERGAHVVESKLTPRPGETARLIATNRCSMISGNTYQPVLVRR